MAVIRRTRQHQICSFILFSLIFLIPVIITSCGGSSKNIKAPPIEIGENALSREIQDYEDNIYPIDKTDAFYTHDKEIYSSIRLRNFSGKHTLRWDWIKPDGKVYYSTGNTPMKTSEGFYKHETSLFHKISILGDRAVDHPGRWTVKIYLDDNVIARNRFELIDEIDIGTMPYFAQKPDPSKWGLVIGIENYSNLPTVQYAEKDALLVKAYFEKILGVPEENIIQMYDKDATKGKIEGFLKSYLPLNLDADSTLYVYFAGHGLPGLKTGEAYLVTNDGDPRFIEHTGYNLNRFYKDIDAIHAKQSFVFIDSCFSGVSTRGKEMLLAGARPALIKVEDIDMPSDRLIALSASKGEQISNAYPDKEHGLFTYFLLLGLRGPADRNADDKIDMDELYAYVKQNVVKTSNRQGVTQTPVALYTSTSMASHHIADVLK